VWFTAFVEYLSQNSWVIQWTVLSNPTSVVLPLAHNPNPKPNVKDMGLYRTPEITGTRIAYLISPVWPVRGFYGPRFLNTITTYGLLEQ